MKKPLTAEQKEGRRVAQRIRRTNELVKTAKSFTRSKCNGKAKLRDEAGNILLGEDGKPLRGPCPNYPIKGGSVCMAHGGSVKRIRRTAQKRMLALVEPAMVALGEIIEQNDHMPSKLGAVRTVLERAGDNVIGALKKAETTDTRPIINIGIAVGGVPGAKAEGVKIGLLPTLDVKATEGDGD